MDNERDVSRCPECDRVTYDPKHCDACGWEMQPEPVEEKLDPREPYMLGGEYEEMA